MVNYNSIQQSKKFGEIRRDINNNNLHLIPTGTMLPYAGKYSADNAPKGYLWCDGQSYKCSDYPDLAEILGFDTSNTYFEVPDMTNRYLKGSDRNRQCKNKDGTLRVSTYGGIGGSPSGYETYYVYTSTTLEDGKRITDTELDRYETNFIIKY